MSGNTITKELSAKMVVYKIWIDSEWYIPVDEKGRCVGPCNEGALGFVVQLRSDKNPKQHMALKLPRLMGETHRENAYIIDLMNKELHAVRDVIHGAGNPEGLLYSSTRDTGPLRGEISPPATDEARRWKGAVIFVCFEKGKNPRFCLAKAMVEKPADDSENPTVHSGQTAMSMLVEPPSIQCPVKDNVMLFTEIRNNARGNNNLDQQEEWVRATFIEQQQTQSVVDANLDARFAVVSFQQAVENNPVGVTWNTCLPSIIYDWAEGTLQQAISRNKRGRWGIREHLLLVRRICRGLVALHNKGMLHADVRPANIVYRGEPLHPETNPINPETNPENYFLTDYGSFAQTGPLAAQENTTGDTVLGPAIRGERASAFYSPERRTGRERETADTAVLLKTSGDTIYVVLGWKPELIDEASGKPRFLLDKYTSSKRLVDSDSPTAAQTNKYAHLLAGDRIQVRDYIFELVADEWHIDNEQVLECKGSFWKIYHGRIVVKCEDKFEQVEWFPIPRTIELPQWSASTDLYSLGALALYSVYQDAQRRAAVHLDDTSSIEENFRSMLDYLASPPYFNTIWPELNWITRELERHLQREDLTAISFTQVKIDDRYEEESKPFMPTGSAIEPQKPDSAAYATPPDLTIRKKIQLHDAVVWMVIRITQTAPGTHDLLYALEQNLGHFIFFMHFVLGCLHRQSDLMPTDTKTFPEQEQPSGETLPFCIDRCEQPRPNGAAAKALQRLKYLHDEVLSNGLLKELKPMPSREIPKYDPRPEPQIRLELQKLRHEQAAWHQERDKLEKQAHLLTQRDQKIGEALEITEEIHPNGPRTNVAALWRKYTSAGKTVLRIQATLESIYQQQSDKSN